MHNIAQQIDHAALHPAMTDKELRLECELALQYKTASVCIKPYAVKLAAEILKDSPVKVCTVIGFPHGNSATSIKLAETELAIKEGAEEIDMVINIGKANSGDWDYISNEIQTHTDLCHKQKRLIKVIFENTYLQDKQSIVKLCQICTSAGADFVKTSTGFDYIKAEDGSIYTVGAQLEDCKLMRENIADKMEVKASGGIRTKADIEAFRKIGVTRFGTSSTKAILS